MDKLELRKTADGSYTLYLPSFDETYHSVHGALQEAEHVFINAGLKKMSQDSLSIMEIGFGTGLNCMLTLLANQTLNKRISYCGIEAYPVGADLIKKLEYPELLDLDEEGTKQFSLIHDSKWEENTVICEGFTLYKQKAKFEELNYKERFQLIYFDAFGARIQPELWGEEMMQRMYKALTNGGVLITYGAKGSFKRALKSVGFIVEGLPGPPGKREMTKATKV